MSGPSTLIQHAITAGFPNIHEYALELEDILEAIVEANHRPDDPDDFPAAVNRAQDLVDTWTTP